MTIRFNPDLYATVLAGLNSNNRDQQQVLLELSGGKRVNAPSDDPSATAIDIGIHSQRDQLDQFHQNIASLQGQLQVADSTMNSLGNLLNQAMTLGTEAGNGTLSAADRTVLANQIQTLSQQALSLSNTTYQGHYIFAGTASNAPAFVADPTSANGVTYKGNAASNQVEISPGQKVTVNVPGSQIFTNGAADVFAALTSLVQVAQTGNGAPAALAQLSAAIDNVSTQRGNYGSVLNQVNSTDSVLAADQVQLSSQENTAVGADIAAAATQLSQVTTARSALLAAGGRIQTTSLLDYLK